MKGFTSLVIAMVTLMTVSGQADILYLKDGSVLNGIVLEETAQDLVIANPGYGELIILKGTVIYRDQAPDHGQTEAFAITPDGTAVVARLQRPVPKSLPGDGSVNQLIPGDVQSVRTLKGTEIPFDKHGIGDHSLVSIHTRNLPDDTEWVVLTSLQTTALTETPSGKKRFQLKYQLDTACKLKIVVKLPVTTQIHVVSPKPQLQSQGLIVWQCDLGRQQIFNPEIVFEL